MESQPLNLELSYDRVAQHYADQFRDELSKKPFDRELLDTFVSQTRGPICEIGCGPGQIARYLKDRGADVRGIDISAGMVAEARRLNPDIPFERGDMLAMPFPDVSFAGVVAFYSIIHIERADVTRALREVKRILRPDGKLLLSFHQGDGAIHREEWYGQPVLLDFILFQPAEMAAYLSEAGMQVEAIQDRAPYDFEAQTRRIYISAISPGVG